jgi:hypothetical protein
MQALISDIQRGKVKRSSLRSLSPSSWTLMFIALQSASEAAAVSVDCSAGGAGQKSKNLLLLLLLLLLLEQLQMGLIGHHRANPLQQEEEADPGTNGHWEKYICKLKVALLCQLDSARVNHPI